MLSMLSALVVKKSVQSLHVWGVGNPQMRFPHSQVQNHCHSHTECKSEVCKKKQSASGGGRKANLVCMEQGNLREKEAVTEGGMDSSALH